MRSRKEQAGAAFAVSAWSERKFRAEVQEQLAQLSASFGGVLVETEETPDEVFAEFRFSSRKGAAEFRSETGRIVPGIRTMVEAVSL